MVKCFKKRRGRLLCCDHLEEEEVGDAGRGLGKFSGN